MADYLLVIDEGTTSTRAILFDGNGEARGSAQHELTQTYPKPGWVEHDASEIWNYSLAAAQNMVDQAGGAAKVSAIGITNQRETIVFWDRRTGEPLCPAIVWQDRRTAAICDQLKADGHESEVQSRTGLLLDPYFSGSKIGWALKHWPQLLEAGENLAVGTVESYLTFRLTGGLHISDASNAARTALMNIDNGKWDPDLCALFGVPMHILPEITDCAGQFGVSAPGVFDAPIAICGMAGDQQAATIGQACFTPGDTKATYGTGAFVLTYTGTLRRQSQHRILSTIGWQIDGERHYALEGSVFVAGSLMQWLRDQLGMIVTAAESEELARSVDHNAGVYIVPALSGLGAPYWRADARAAITGLTFSATRAHLVRAALEAMAYQTADLKSAFAADGADWKRLRIDGGMVANSWMAQDLADILNIEVDRPEFVETTALGAAMLVAVGAGLYPDLQSAAVMRKGSEGFAPMMGDDNRMERMAGWASAVKSVLQQGAN